MAHVLVGAIQEQQEPPAETAVLSFWPLSLPHKLIEVGTHHSTDTQSTTPTSVHRNHPRT